MTDEKYTFVQDLREKKQIAHSSRYRRTHTGKSGAVRLPNDKLKRKEWEAMNGEVTRYRLNEPMGWKTFKSMPDDLKIEYIKKIRARFGVTDAAIAEMLGVSRVYCGGEFRRLGLGEGKSAGAKKHDADNVGFAKWANGEHDAIQPESPVEQIEDEQPVITAQNAEKAALLEPNSGTMCFTGAAVDVMRTMAQLLGWGVYQIKISWKPAERGGATDG